MSTPNLILVIIALIVLAIAAITMTAIIFGAKIRLAGKHKQGRDKSSETTFDVTANQDPH